MKKKMKLIKKLNLSIKKKEFIQNHKNRNCIVFCYHPVLKTPYYNISVFDVELDFCDEKNCPSTTACICPECCMDRDVMHHERWRHPQRERWVIQLLTQAPVETLTAVESRTEVCAAIDGWVVSIKLQKIQLVEKFFLISVHFKDGIKPIFFKVCEITYLYRILHVK